MIGPYTPSLETLPMQHIMKFIITKALMNWKSLWGGAITFNILQEIYTSTINIRLELRYTLDSCGATTTINYKNRLIHLRNQQEYIKDNIISKNIT